MRQLANVDDWSTAATAVRDEELASERGGQSLSNGSDGAQGSERLAIILWDEEPPRVPAPQQPSYGGGQGASQGAVTVGR